MIKVKFLRWLVVLVLVVVGVVVAAVTGSVPPFRNRPHITPPPPHEQLPTPFDTPAAIQDRAKGIYEGPVGEFLVIPRQVAEFPSCPRPHTLTQKYKDSELYSPVFGENLEVYECANGKIVTVTAYGGAVIGRRYFVGPAKVPFEAPFDRLVLLAVGRHSALAQLPVPGDPASLRLAAIQRFPTSHEPGIMVGIDNTSKTLEEAVTLAAQIMGVRP